MEKKVWLNPHVLKMIESLDFEIKNEQTDKRGNISKIINILLEEVLEDFFDFEKIFNMDPYYKIFEYKNENLIAVNSQFSDDDIINELSDDFPNLKRLKKDIKKSDLYSWKIDKIIDDL